MGQGRRMGKKQGAPEPLSEAHFAKLKRKAGLPVETPAESPTVKKRRTGKASQEPIKANGAKNGSKKAEPKKINGSKAGAGAARNGAAPKKGSAKRARDDDSDSDSLPDDEFELEDSDGVEGLEDLGDDFIGSDDDSVVDSDEEVGQKEKFVFSDDEDDSDREEKLTAANIEGLSAKLDKELEEEAEMNEAELRESAMQTNIDGDRPKILGEDADGESPKKKASLAPDLQLLRTRITETIRVLESFSELAEEGRSRTEYRDQVIKDGKFDTEPMQMPTRPEKSSNTT